VGTSGGAYASVFFMESLMFLVSAACAVHVGRMSITGGVELPPTAPAWGHKGST
jgi:hypothetical protein